MKKIILASASPRRQELLKGLDVEFEVRLKKGIKESFPKDIPSLEVPEYISKEKAAAYEVADDEILLTADTVVEMEGKIYGKPKNEADACRMLGELSGRTHEVITGVTLTTSNEQRSFSVITEVTFKELTKEEIEYYVSHYHPLDKAGAYGIQEWIGYIGCTGIKGSYYNVMGLPVQRIYSELQKMHFFESK
ncbi:MAG: Maf-like protein [Prevotella sp.]|jgi:septum formation protein